jgi:hypothetical protein
VGEVNGKRGLALYDTHAKTRLGRKQALAVCDDGSGMYLLRALHWLKK